MRRTPTASMPRGAFYPSAANAKTPKASAAQFVPESRIGLLLLTLAAGVSCQQISPQPGPHNRLLAVPAFVLRFSRFGCLVRLLLLFVNEFADSLEKRHEC